LKKLNINLSGGDKNLSTDKGKPVERQGRKAIGPNAKAMAAWLPKGEIFS